MAKPAHKVNTKHDRPGQIVNPLPEQTTKKLTFEEWWLSKNRKFNEHGYESYVDYMTRKWDAEKVWKAAQENK